MLLLATAVGIVARLCGDRTLAFAEDKRESRDRTSESAQFVMNVMRTDLAGNEMLREADDPRGDHEQGRQQRSPSPWWI